MSKLPMAESLAVLIKSTNGTVHQALLTKDEESSVLAYIAHFLHDGKLKLMTNIDTGVTIERVQL